VKFNPSFRGRHRFHVALLAACFMLVSSLVYFYTLKKETMCSSEKSADFHQATRRYIPEDKILPPCCENFKSNKNSNFIIGNLVLITWRGEMEFQNSVLSYTKIFC
jgi:hypothetical protein